MTEPPTEDQPQTAAPSFTTGWKIFVVSTFLLSVGIGSVRSTASRADSRARTAGIDVQRMQSALQQLERRVEELARRLDAVERR